MSRDIDRPMRHADAVCYFENEMMPFIRAQEARQSGGVDMPLRCETWNNWVDSLCKDNCISDWQQDNWSHPPSCN